VVGKVLHGALAGDQALSAEAQHGDHGEAPVLQLLHLELSKGVGVVGQAKGVKGLTRVQGVQALAGGAAVDAVALNQAHEHQLGQQDGDDGLGVDSFRTKTNKMKKIKSNLSCNGLNSDHVLF